MVIVRNGSAGDGPQGGGDVGFLSARYSPALRRFFGRRVDAADVDDLVQDVLLKVQAANACSRIENAESYLFRVARNVLVSRYRGRRGVTEQLEKDREPVDDLSPERILIARQEYDRVRRAILNLPPRARAAFEFHRFENMTYPEIARTMGISRDRVKQLMRRAIEGISADGSDVGNEHD